MANPGSPDAMRQRMNSAENMPQMPKSTMIGMLLTLGIMFIILMYREQVGGYMDYVFRYISFDAKYPVATLMIAGIIMTTLSSILRSALSDPLKMAKSQNVQKQFSAEMKKARMENNLYKIKKLTEQQPMMMASSMEASQDQMKIMPVTMLVVIPIYTWVFYFLQLGDYDVNTIINVPWSAGVDLLKSYVLPSWILIYTLISIPIGQLVNKTVRFILLKRRIEQLDKETRAAV
ncbi:MAG TPA: EMC3/TMCO1 family protein [Candidatus Methanomethylophilaceae archaeon]|nr:EMC3/TMCO1 family protein [Candidatus Methanomethylophilaceae archaeon]